MDTDFSPFLHHLEKRKDAMILRVLEWANVNSGSFNVSGLNHMGTLIAETFRELEPESTVHNLPPIEQLDDSGAIIKRDLGPCLRFWKRPKAPVQVLLMGHMDTVYHSEHPFQKAVLLDDRVHGPGVTDMKGGICVLFEALNAFEKSPYKDKLGWEVIINPDEEIGSPGSAKIIAERAKHHTMGLLFEPAMDEQGTLAGERKGSGGFTVAVHGRSAHAGRAFHQGRNAITTLARILVEMDQLNHQREGLTLNVGQVFGGIAPNVVPAFAMAKIDIRFQELEDEKWLLQNFNDLVEKTKKLDGFSVEIKGGLHRKPKRIEGRMLSFYEFVKKVGDELGYNLGWKLSGGCCDGNNLAEAGVVNVDSLGVCGNYIHSEKEYLLTQSLVDRAKLTAAILYQLSQGAFKD